MGGTKYKMQVLYVWVRGPPNFFWEQEWPTGRLCGRIQAQGDTNDHRRFLPVPRLCCRQERWALILGWETFKSLTKSPTLTTLKYWYLFSDLTTTKVLVPNLKNSVEIISQ